MTVVMELAAGSHTVAQENNGKAVAAAQWEGKPFQNILTASSRKC